MNNYKIWIAVGILSLVHWIAFVSECAAQSNKKPNVVIILTDDMGYGDISCYNRNQIKTGWEKRICSHRKRSSN